jgi:recombination associated protein RdgC
LFRNLVLYRLPAGFAPAAPEFEAALDRRPLQACGSFDMQTRGFVACGYEQRTLYSQGQQHLLCLGVEQKLLPASIINQVAKERAVELEQQQGHPVGRRQMRELKLRVGDELRARALTRRRTTFAWLDLPGGWLAVNTASNGRAEELVETLRDALGTLPVVPFNTRHASAGSMAAWLTHGDAPGRFTIAEDLELKAIDGNGAAIRYTRHALDAAEIRHHLGTGKAPTRLGLTWNGRISFLLHENLHVKRVQFLDVYKDENAKGENPHEQFDIDFALMTGELRQLLGELAEALGGAVTEAPKPAALAEKQAA